MKSISKSETTSYKFDDELSLRFEGFVPLTKTEEMLGAIVQMPPVH